MVMEGLADKQVHKVEDQVTRTRTLQDGHQEGRNVLK